MKQINSFLKMALCILFATTANAQTFLSHSLQTGNANNNYITSLTLATEFNYGSCLLTNYNVSMSGNTINLTVNYTTGILTYICSRTDVFEVGNSLPCGNYSLLVNTYVSGNWVSSNSLYYNFYILCGSPGNLIATNVDAREAEVEWDISCAYGYQVQFREVGSDKFRSKKVNTNTGSAVLKGLKPNTAYEWQVGSECSTNPPTYSFYSALHTFVTTGARYATYDTNAMMEAERLIDFTVSPNPASEHVTITFKTEISIGHINVYNIVGEVVYSEKLHEVTTADKIHIGLDVQPGIYFIQASNAEGKNTKKLIIY